MSETTSHGPDQNNPTPEKVPHSFKWGERPVHDFKRDDDTDMSLPEALELGKIKVIGYDPETAEPIVEVPDSLADHEDPEDSRTEAYSPLVSPSPESSVDKPGFFQRRSTRIGGALAAVAAVAATAGIMALGNSNNASAGAPSQRPTASGPANPGKKTSEHQNTQGEAVVLSQRAAENYGRSTDLNSDADREAYQQKFYTPFTQEGFNTLYTPGELQKLEHNSDDAKNFFETQKFGYSGQNEVDNLNDQVASMAETLGAPQTFSNPELVQQYYGDKLDSKNILTEEDFKRFVETKDVKGLYEKLSGFSEDNFSHAEILYLDDLIALAESTGDTQNPSDEVSNKLGELQMKYEPLATLGMVGPALDDLHYDNLASEFTAIFKTKDSVKNLKDRRAQVEAMRKQKIETTDIKLLGNTCMTPTGTIPQLNYDPSQGGICKIAFEKTYSIDGGQPVTDLVEFVTMPAPVEGAKTYKGVIGLSHGTLPLS